MKMMRVVSVLAACGLAGAAFAQEPKPTVTVEAQPAPSAEPRAPKPEPKWSDADMERAAKLFTGFWRSKPVGQMNDASKTIDVVLGIAPVYVSGMENVLYVEAARGDALWAPFRQSLWQFYKKGSQIRLRTIEVRRTGGEWNNAQTTWAVPDFFPSNISSKDMVATMDFDITLSASSVAGRTPHPYPTAIGGAVETVGEFKLTGDTFESSDRGLKADGSVAWGVPKGEWIQFKREAAPIEVRRDSTTGLVIVDYKAVNRGEPAKEGDRIALHYFGILAESGRVFDNTRENGQPFLYFAGQQLIPGFTNGMKEVRVGDRRRLFIPSDQGFGPQGNRRSRIPANADLIYDIEVVSIETPPPAPPTPPPTADTKLEVQPVEKPPFQTEPPK